MEEETVNMWYVLQLTADGIAAGDASRVREEFNSAFVAARGPRTMALFQREREEGGAELFLTPVCAVEAGELIERWRFSPCDRPSLIGLQLLVGHSEITYYMP